MTKELFENITAWQKRTFPTTTPLSSAFHLEEEVRELLHSIQAGKVDRAEIADCFLLLFDLCSRSGLSYADVTRCIIDKMQINYCRKWSKPNEKGYIRHID